MKLKNKNLISKPQKKFTLLGLMAFFYPLIASAQTDNGVSFFPNKSIGFIEILTIFVMIIVGFVLFLVLKIITKANDNLEDTNLGNDKKFKKYLVNLNSWQIEVLKKKRNQINKIISILILGFISLAPQFTFAQTAPAKREGIFSQPGVLITLVLIFIPLFLALLYLATKVYKGFNDYFYFQKTKEAEDFAAYISLADNIPTNAKLERIRKKLNYSITSNELSGNKKANDAKGLLKNISSETNYRFFASKRPAIKRPKIDPELTKLVLWFLGTAVFWLLIGSSIGEYVGIKFIAPDADTYSWLSIGRLRAVHTNLVFWAWSTIGIMGLGYYIVPMVSNTPLNNIKNGWKALIAVNLAMFVGAITLMAGINNAGGEYREIIWPIMAVWLMACY
ncbi:cbb3-type cytochrome c oxidase subunit I [Flavobacterium psychrophilum]|uniref:cbb3-type cytochrome c oxidase subunit I n=1 Tax=Flavobacterium psychrophilum TaxID=96345 RepID=UPI000ABF49F0|nr:cbb3-type cytochrome c oxidase subunit I [Flavobacterium psychrophilum]